MLAGIAVGNWIDRRWPSRYSWTLMLLVGGLLLGCVSAWNRVTDEQEHR
jgi:ATP synthase protein I